MAETPLCLLESRFPFRLVLDLAWLHALEVKDRVADCDIVFTPAKAGARKSGILVTAMFVNAIFGKDEHEMELMRWL